MKRLIFRRLVLAGLLLAARIAADMTGASAIKAAEPQTELGKLAASMKPGTWAELKTEGYTLDLLKVPRAAPPW